MTNVVSVVAGGAIGALCRYGVHLVITPRVSGHFPWATLTINLVGCLLIGVVWAFFEQMPVSPQARLFAVTGVLGAFTTFSTFSLEGIALLTAGKITAGLLYILISNLAGLMLTLAGLLAVKSFLA